MNDFKTYFGDLIKTILILVISFMICLLMQTVFSIEHLIPAIFTVSVFLVTLFTQGYAYGVGASLVSVLAVNFAFTFPYLKFNFNIPENFFSAVIMLTVTLFYRGKCFAG